MFFNKLRLICIKSIIISLSIMTTTLSQITFFKTYGDSAEDHDDKGYAIIQTSDSGYVIAGEYGIYREGTSNYYGDVYVIKTNIYGDTIWTRKLGDAKIRETARSMVQTFDRGYLISAYIQAPLWQLWLIKLNSEGDSIWSKKYHLGIGNCIIETDDLGYVITGQGINDNYVAYLLKIDSLGNTKWTKSYRNSIEDAGEYVQQTKDGGYIISGYTTLIDKEIWIIKTNSLGDTSWTKTYGSEYIDIAHSIYETINGGYFLAGEYTEEGELGLENHIWLLLTDSWGDTLWTKKINTGSWEDYIYSMKRTSDGGYILCGEKYYDDFNSDIYLIKLDDMYIEQWYNTIGQNLGEKGDDKNYRGFDVTETFDGGYIITGFKWIWFGINEYMDLCLLKVNNKGQITNLHSYNQKMPLNDMLFSNYPNPFNSITTIQYNLTKDVNVMLEVFNVQGQKVKTLVNSHQKAGRYEVQFDGANLASGVYIYKIKAGNFTQSKRMLLIK
ncbi:MAG: T9SS type A sorting domain-containing protein [Calditrichaceae bacterium]|nr:T9SS type A sorting domain-containing protein [Calditrichaceae bacterium]